jgi:hypothetical protein
MDCPLMLVSPMDGESTEHRGGPAGETTKGHAPGCRPLVRRIGVEEFHGVLPHVGAQVRITHRHLDRGVAEQLLRRREGI